MLAYFRRWRSGLSVPCSLSSTLHSKRLPWQARRMASEMHGKRDAWHAMSPRYVSALPPHLTCDNLFLGWELYSLPQSSKVNIGSKRKTKLTPKLIQSKYPKHEERTKRSKNRHKEKGTFSTAKYRKYTKDQESRFESKRK